MMEQSNTETLTILTRKVQSLAEIVSRIDNALEGWPDAEREN
jgi:hypothetical protein